MSDDRRDFAVVTPASLLTTAFDPNRFNVVLADRFWKNRVAFYLPALQGRNKWRETSKNLQIGDLVVVGDFADISASGKYRVGRVAEVFPQMHNGNPIARRTKIAVTEYDSKTDSTKWSIYTVTSHVLHLSSRLIPTNKQLNLL